MFLYHSHGKFHCFGDYSLAKHVQLVYLIENGGLSALPH